MKEKSVLTLKMKNDNKKLINKKGEGLLKVLTHHFQKPN